MYKLCSDAFKVTTRKDKPMWLLIGGGRLQELRPYWVKNFSWLEYGNCRDLTHAPMLICRYNVLFMQKVNFKKKSIEKFPFFVFYNTLLSILVAYGRLKTKENFKLLAHIFDLRFSLVTAFFPSPAWTMACRGDSWPYRQGINWIQRKICK